MSTQQRVLKDEILFNGGLDTDSDEKFVQQGDYMDARNVTKFYDGSGGVVVNIKGNEEITNSYLPVGTNKCIGWCEDDANNAIIFFNYNSNNNHGIYRYLKDSDTFQKILHNESILGFVSDCYNLQANVIGDLLYWNEGKDSSGDYINVPRKINIEKARLHTNGLGGDAYDDITVDVMSVIKRPYLGYLNCSFAYDSSYAYGSKFIKKDFYRFSLQLVYDDNEESVLGSYSNICENIYYDSDNYIGIRFKYFDVDGTLAKIRIYGVKNFSNSPFLIKEIDINDIDGVYDSTDNTTVSSLTEGNYYVYRFYGVADGRYYDGNTNLFDNVPVYANSQTLTDNVLLYGNVELSKDFGNTNTNAVYIPVYALSSPIYDSTALNSTTVSDSGTYGFAVDVLPDITNFVGANTTHFVHVLWEASSSISGSSNDYTSFHMKIDARKICPYWSFSKILEYVLEHSDVYVKDSGGNIIEGYLSNTDSAIIGEITDDGSLSSLTVEYNIIRYDKANNLAYKSLSNLNFAVVFFDKYGRCLGYQLDDSITYPSQERTTLLYDAVSKPYNYITNFFAADEISFPINRSKPYNYITNFFAADEISFPINSDVDYVSIVSSGNLDFTGCWQLTNPDTLEDSSELIGFSYPKDYSYVDGDVLRVITDDNDGKTLWEIFSFDEDYIYVSNDCEYDGLNGDSIEILRFKGDEANIFHEIRTFDVSEGSPAKDNETFDYLISDGDIWLDVDEEDNSIYEKFYDRNDISIRSSGRVFAERVDFDKTEFKHIYFSNKYFDNTNINGLNTFVSTNRVELSDDNGDIIGLERLGEVLYAIQRKEITSFYLGKTILKQSSGGDVIADTSKFLGGKRESAFNYGSTFQVGIMDNYIFGYDIYKGVFWMNAFNGINIISGKSASNNYKMDYYFKEKSKSLLSSGIENVNVLIGVDKSKEVIYVTFLDSNDSSNNETIAYHLPTNKWISKYSFIPEKYAWLDDKFFSFKTGKLYEHDSDDVNRCTFYGSYNSSYIQFISHALPNKVKIFNSIGIHSDASWSNDSIEIDPSTSYPNGMYTKVLDSEWIYEEGVQKCYMPRNMKTRTSTANNYDRINGEEMRGKVVKVKITNDDTDKVELFKVDINAELSR